MSPGGQDRTTGLWDPAMGPDRLVAFVTVAIAIVVAVFFLLAAVRLWSIWLQKGGPVSRGLDLQALRRKVEAGEVSEEEYDAVCRQMAAPGAAPKGPNAGAGPAEAAPDKPPINPKAGDETAERNQHDGQEHQRPEGTEGIGPRRDV